MEIPQEHLELEYIFGYSCRSCRSLHCLGDGRLAYAASAVVVVHLINDNSQNHFVQHEDEITAIAMHPNSKFLASGETGFKPRIFVWDSGSIENHRPIKTIGPALFLPERTISPAAIQFSRNGKYLVAIGNDSNHICRVFNWKNSLVLYEGRSAQAPVRGISFLHDMTLDASSDADYAFVSIGNKHIRFWSMSRRQLSTKWDIESNTSSFRNNILCSDWLLPELCIVGDSTGTLMVYTQRRKKPLPGADVSSPLPPREAKGVLCGKLEHIHYKGVTAISKCKFLKGNVFATGGGDGTVAVRTLCVREEDRTLCHKEKIRFNLSELGTGNKDFDSVVSLSWGEESRDDMVSEKQTFKAKKKLKAFSNSKSKKTSPFLKSSATDANRPGVRGKAHAAHRRLILHVGLKSSMIVSVIFETPPHADWDGQPWKFKVRIVQANHFSGVEGAIANLNENYFFSVGRDRVIRLYDVVDRICLSYFKVPYPAISASLNPHGTHLAVGLINASIVILEITNLVNDGNVGSQRKVTMKIKHYLTVEQKRKKRNLEKDQDDDDNNRPRRQKMYKSTEEVQCLAYSPSGKFLAAGSRDNYIYIFDVINVYTIVQVLKGHSSFVLNIDWTIDSKYLQSSDGAHEILYWKCLDDGTQTQNPKFGQEAHTLSLADAIWDTYTNIFGWSVSGIWRKNADATDINSVSRSTTGNLLVTGDDFMRVNLFRYPCIEGASPRMYSGHHSHVMCVRWATKDDKYIISCGGNDGCVFLWRCCI